MGTQRWKGPGNASSQDKKTQALAMECRLIVTLLIGLCIAGGASAVYINPCWRATRDFDIVSGDTCFSYIFCYYGYPISGGWCYRGTAFDPQVRLCTTRAYDICRELIYQEPVAISRRQFQCPTEVAEAVYPDYSDGCPTSSYIKCRYGKAETLTCRNNLYFNEGIDQCDIANNIPCGSSPRCPRDLVYGVYADYSEGCPSRSYYQCYGALRYEPVRITNVCPEGLFYNEGIKNCDFKRNVPCSNNTKS